MASRPASRPTANTFSILGLLAVQPFTAYELVSQAKRSLHHFWPRSEAHIYAELKRLVDRGYAYAERAQGRRRQATLYTITDAGRQALQAWLTTTPGEPLLEVEGLLRTLLADQGTIDDLRSALYSTADQARALLTNGLTIVEDLVATGGPFPQRQHLSVPIASFYERFMRMVIEWCDEMLAEIQTWPDTRDVGLTPGGRQRLEQIIADAPSWLGGRAAALERL